MKRIVSALVACAIAAAFISSQLATAAGALPSPEQFLGFKVGADYKFARWDTIVSYMKLAAAAAHRVRYRELGRTTNGNPFIALEISAPDTLRNLDRYKAMARKVYFQGVAPSEIERSTILSSRSFKASRRSQSTW